MTAAHNHPDFANVVRVPHFHQAPRRAQYLGMVDRLPDNVVVYPLIAAGCRRRFARLPAAPPVFDHARFHRDLAEAAAALKAMATELPSDCEPAPA